MTEPEERSRPAPGARGNDARRERRIRGASPPEGEGPREGDAHVAVRRAEARLERTSGDAFTTESRKSAQRHGSPRTFLWEFPRRALGQVANAPSSSDPTSPSPRRRESSARLARGGPDERAALPRRAPSPSAGSESESRRETLEGNPDPIRHAARLLVRAPRPPLILDDPHRRGGVGPPGDRGAGRDGSDDRLPPRVRAPRLGGSDAPPRTPTSVGQRGGAPLRTRARSAARRARGRERRGPRTPRGAPNAPRAPRRVRVRVAHRALGRRGAPPRRTLRPRAVRVRPGCAAARARRTPRRARRASAPLASRAAAVERLARDAEEDARVRAHRAVAAIPVPSADAEIDRAARPVAIAGRRWRERSSLWGSNRGRPGGAL